MQNPDDFLTEECNGTQSYDIPEYEDLLSKELYLLDFLSSFNSDISFDHPRIDGAYTKFIVTGKHNDELGKMIIRMDAIGAGDEIPKFSHICAGKMQGLTK